MKAICPYDEARKEFIPDTGILPWLVRTFRGVMGLPMWRPPTAVDLANYLTYAVEIDRRVDSIALLTHHHKDSMKARAFLQQGYDEVDQEMGDQKLRARNAMPGVVSQQV